MCERPTGRANVRAPKQCVNHNFWVTFVFYILCVKKLSFHHYCMTFILNISGFRVLTLANKKNQTASPKECLLYHREPSLCARPARSRSDNELNGGSSVSLSARAARSRSTNEGASDMVSSSSSGKSRLLRPWE